MAISVTGLTRISHKHPSRALRKPREGVGDPPAATAAPPGSGSQEEACGGRRTCGTQAAAHFAFWRRRKASFKLRGQRRAAPRPRAARSAAAPTAGRSFHQAPAAASHPGPLAAPWAPRSPQGPPSRGVPPALPSQPPPRTTSRGTRREGPHGVPGGPGRRSAPAPSVTGLGPRNLRPRPRALGGRPDRGPPPATWRCRHSPRSRPASPRAP